VPAVKRELVAYVIGEHGLSVRQACRAVDLSRTVYAYHRKPDRDTEVIAVLQELVERFPRYGFKKLFQLIRRRGHHWNHKRVYRVYCGLRLNMRRKGKKRLPSRNPAPLTVPDRVNRCWSMDFMSDALWDGRRFRTFNVVDDFNREVLGIDIDTNLPGPRVQRFLDRIAAWRGYPEKMRVDNGPELTSVILADWAEEKGVELEFIEPGKPAQNAFIERFNRTYRHEVLDMYVFQTLSEVREITDNWLMEYNEIRPHESLGNLTPEEYRKANQEKENSTNPWH
jgi:putative transposase